MLIYHNRRVGFRAFYDSKCLVDPIAASSEPSVVMMVEDLRHWEQT